MSYGLTYVPSNGDKDRPPNFAAAKKRISRVYSTRDQSVLREAFRSLAGQRRLVLEIGVSNHGDGASGTQVLLVELPADVLYLGVDTQDKCYIERANVHTLRCDSSDLERVMAKVEELCGERVIDFLHIDGWHSVDQVVRDWRYAEFVSPFGVIVLHDTNFHPGPVALLPAIDRELFDVNQFFKERDDDWGITVVRKWIKDPSAIAEM
jgi:hypothetical protein